MKRLTEKDDYDGYKIEAKNLTDHCVSKDKRGYITYRGEHIEKLAEYENLEEQGLLHIAPIPNGTIIYVWQTDEDDCWFIHNEAYLYGFTEYYHGEFGKKFL